jgi:hypothetical protein
MLFAFRTECCSESQRNRVRLQAGIAFTFDRIPQPTSGTPEPLLHRAAITTCRVGNRPRIRQRIRYQIRPGSSADRVGKALRIRGGSAEQKRQRAKPLISTAQVQRAQLRLLSGSVEKPTPLGPVNREQQHLVGRRRLRRNHHKEFESRSMNLFNVKITQKNSGPPRFTGVWYTPHGWGQFLDTLKALAKGLRITGNKLERTPRRRGRHVMKLMNGTGAFGEEVRNPTTINRAISLRISQRRIERFTAIAMARNQNASQGDAECERTGKHLRVNYSIAYRCAESPP